MVSANGAVETFEIERKYAVTEGAELPTEGRFAELGFTLDAPERTLLEAAYFDTPEAALGMQRVAVRNRLGGKDEGWHMKFKGADGSRELLWPHAAEMPEGLRGEIAQRIGEAELSRVQLIARLRTVRTVTRVLDASGSWMVELADDRVASTNGLTGAQDAWREWEAELAPDASLDLLDLVEPLLLAAGATRVRGTSKLQRAMGRPPIPVNDVTGAP